MGREAERERERPSFNRVNFIDPHDSDAQLQLMNIQNSHNYMYKIIQHEHANIHSITTTTNYMCTISPYWFWNGIVLFKVCLHGEALLTSTADVLSLCLQQLHCPSPDNCAYEKHTCTCNMHACT